MAEWMKDACAAPLLLVAVCMICGCSHFDQEWRAAIDRPARGIEGRWKGKWVSEVDGHSGPIQCAVRRQGPTTYLASFSGTFWEIFPFQYDATLRGQANDGQVNLSGAQDLGIPMGVFFYNGHAEDDRFYLTYHSQYDGGHFVMTRP